MPGVSGLERESGSKVDVSTTKRRSRQPGSDGGAEKQADLIAPLSCARAACAIALQRKIKTAIVRDIRVSSLVN